MNNEINCIPINVNVINVYPKPTPYRNEKTVIIVVQCDKNDAVLHSSFSSSLTIYPLYCLRNTITPSPCAIHLICHLFINCFFKIDFASFFPTDTLTSTSSAFFASLSAASLQIPQHVLAPNQSTPLLQPLSVCIQIDTLTLINLLCLTSHDTNYRRI